MLFRSAGKGWRWAGEMEEISASMTADGLPGGFHQAAAEVFRAASHGAASDGAASAGTASNGTASHRTASPDGADGPDDALIDAVLALLLAGGA